MKLDREFETLAARQEYLGGDFVKLLERGRIKIRDGKRMQEGQRKYEVILKVASSYAYGDGDTYSINRTFGAYVVINDEGKITTVDIKGNSFGYEYREDYQPKKSSLPNPEEIKNNLLGCYWSDVVGFTSFNYDDGFNHLNEDRTIQVRIPVTANRAYHGWVGLDESGVVVSLQLTSVGCH